MGGGGTPRQQMVGMMYLVLLAMLAMNASKSLLNAFVMLENGINKTVNNFANANSKFPPFFSSLPYLNSIHLLHEVSAP